MIRQQQYQQQLQAQSQYHPILVGYHPGVKYNEPGGHSRKREGMENPFTLFPPAYASGPAAAPPSMYVHHQPQELQSNVEGMAHDFIRSVYNTFSPTVYAEFIETIKEYFAEKCTIEEAKAKITILFDVSPILSLSLSLLNTSVSDQIFISLLFFSYCCSYLK
jgi:hypothetical protein